MKHEVKFRITVVNRPPGVTMKVQKGKNELLEPTQSDESKLVFDFDLQVDLTAGEPNFLGKFAQGPKDARFVYVNSGSYAGQNGTFWSRRAKLSLMSISKEEVESVVAKPGSRFETTLDGTGRDGGPVCASVKGLEWRIAAK